MNLHTKNKPERSNVGIRTEIKDELKRISIDTKKTIARLTEEAIIKYYNLKS